MSEWPRLEYESWKETYKTLHLWTQIVGKIRLSKEPWVNHSWYTTLYVTSRGIGTSAISNGEKNFSVDFDFIDHRLIFRSSDGGSLDYPLQSEDTATVYKRIMNSLKELKIKACFDPHPNEIPDTTSFVTDTRPRVYNSEQAYVFWQILVRAHNIFKKFRSSFVGKCSPVHFFWGSFDLAVTRFSGRRAPEHPGHVPHLADRIVREAYSHEVSSCGFWPGNEMYPHPAFYSYAYPEPIGFSDVKIQIPEAFYHPTMREFILPYEDVRNSPHPGEKLLNFLQSTYEAAANLGRWNRDLLEESPYRNICQTKRYSSAITSDDASSP